MPVFLAKSSYGPYFLFGGFSLATLIVLVTYLPETRGVSLEEVEAVFQRPLKGWTFHLTRLLGAAQSNQPGSSESTSHSSIELSAMGRGLDLSAFDRIEA